MYLNMTFLTSISDICHSKLSEQFRLDIDSYMKPMQQITNEIRKKNMRIR